MRSNARSGRLWMLALVLIGMLAAPGAVPRLHAGAAAEVVEPFEFSRLAMGTRLRIVVHPDPARDGDDRERLEAEVAAVVAAVFAEVETIEQSLSDWRESSELRALDRAAGGQAMPVSDVLMDALLAARTWAERTGGAFDPTIGPVTALWRRSLDSGAAPSGEELAAAAALVRWEDLELRPASEMTPVERDDGRARDHASSPPAGTARLARPEMRLDLGGIGKGIAVDRAIESLREKGHTRVLVDFGSAVAAGAAPPGRESWRVRVPTLGAVELVNGAVAISGDDEQALVIDGVRHSHLTDPRSGTALTNRARAVVFTERAADADALATALCVLGPEGVIALRDAAQTSFEAEVTIEDDAAERTIATPAFAARVGPAGVSAAATPVDPPAMRRRDAGKGRLALDVATITLRAEGRPEVSLVGVAHVGEASLYRRLQALLDAHDVVLYESVMPQGSAVPGGGDARERRRTTRESLELLAMLAARVEQSDGALPATLAALAEAVGAVDSRLPAVARALTRDAWGNPIEVTLVTETPHENGAVADGPRTVLVLRSFGSDGVEGGRRDAADIVVRSSSVPAGSADDGLQAQLATALGLAYQLTSIDYDKPGWHCADMTIDQFNTALRERGVESFALADTLAGTSFPAAMAKLVLRLVRFADGLFGGGIREMIKAVLIEVLAEPEAILAGGVIEPGAIEVLIGDRNQVAVDALRNLPVETPRVAIFYGAAHLPDFVERLREQLGYEPAAVEWFTAMESDLGKAGIDPRQLEQLRMQIRRAIRTAPTRRP